MLRAGTVRLIWAAAWGLLVFAPVAGAQDFPALTGRVVDNAALLDATAEREIDAALDRHEQQTGEQFVVVTLPSLQGYDIADYGYRLGRQWQIGEADEDTGALLIVAPNERQVRIEVGYGLEGELTDATSRIIIEREIVPAFRAGDFQAGIERGVAAMLAASGGTYDPSPLPGQPAGDAGAEQFALMAILAVWALIFVLAAMRERQRPRRGGRARGGYGGPIIIIDDGRGSAWPRGGGSGGFGGGFGGGGGSFGGGGASGSW